MQDNIRIEKERKYWDKIAPEYEHSVIEKYWKVYPSLLDKISKDIGVGNTILEVATGTGLVALKVAERAGRVYAVDISQPMIAEAKKKMKETGIKNIEFSAHDAYSLPFDRLKEPKSAQELADLLGFQAGGTAAYLEMLVAMALLDKNGDKYVNKPETTRYLTSDSTISPGSKIGCPPV